MGDMRAEEPRRWERWNFCLLALFAPVLIATGVAGFLLPPSLALMSGAPAYNVFHLVAGALGALLVLGRRALGIAAFNLGFGLIDLYQAVAGPAGLFPADLFALRPADHLVHAALGVVLVAFGARAFATASPARATRQETT